MNDIIPEQANTQMFLSKSERHDEEIRAIFDAIHGLMVPQPEPLKRQIGCHAKG